MALWEGNVDKAFLNHMQVGYKERHCHLLVDIAGVSTHMLQNNVVVVRIEDFNFN